MTARVRILVIGASGFVGRHLVSALAAEYGYETVTGVSHSGTNEVGILDICDAEAVQTTLQTVSPSHVVNLSGVAAPADAGRREDDAWRIHVHASVTLGRLMAETVPKAWLFHIGSGLAYGAQALHGKPVSEIEPLAPLDPYGVTKAAGDLAIGALAAQGLRVIRLRPFNHTGPGQSEAFAIPSFAAQIARIEAGQRDPVLSVGNLMAARDYLHVEDVVAAYTALIRNSAALRSGDIFNIASGSPQVMGELLNRLLFMSKARITVEADPTRQRASELPTIAGNADQLRIQTGWTPSRSLDEMLRDVLRDCRSRVQRNTPA